MSADRVLHLAQEGASGLAFVMIPSAGSSHTVFAPVVPLLDRARVLVACPRGRMRRIAEPPLGSITGIAREYVAALDGRLGTEPWVLVGHSMGALVGREMLDLLPAAGLSMPQRFVVSACGAPRAGTISHLADAPDDDLLSAVWAMGGTEQALMDAPHMRALLLTPLRDDLRAIATHVPATRPVDVDIAVFLGHDDTLVEADAQAWSTHTTSGLDLEWFDGGHFYFREHPSAMAASLLRAGGLPESAGRFDAHA